MRQMTTKYDEFLSRLYVAAARAGEIDIFLDRTKDLNKPTLYMTSVTDIKDKLYNDVITAITACGHEVIQEQRTKKKLAIRIGVKK